MTLLGARSTTVRCPNCGHVLATVDVPALPAIPPPVETVGSVLLRVSDAAALLGISRSAAYQLIGSGVLPVVRLGRSTRVPRASIDELIARGTARARGDRW